jgi:KUP system potassium uptake protein
MTPRPERARRSGRLRIATLSLGALGVVYGDIGTSPLYALRESFEGAGHEIPVDEANILGVLSLIVWSLIIIISIKYLVFVMRADNEHEGGILALTALIPSGLGRRVRLALVVMGVFGTALLYGDGMITPAISVLSAVEGAEIATDRLGGVVVPIAVAILVALFSVQRRGTNAVGRVFGPTMVVWFSTLALLGLVQLVAEPTVLRAFWPGHAVQFFAENGMSAFLALGSVFLVVTGGEALYADMGHFGRRPITLTWYALVLPALTLNYLGQGALLLGDAGAIDNPFYRMAPEAAVLPLVVLSTLASVIASQALISGAFSLTRQAVGLGYLPRVRIIHTSASERGQVYVPVINWTLMIASCALVIGFGSSSNLAAAYGIAVTATMAITTVLFTVIARRRFGWPRTAAVAFAAVMLSVDLAFFGANLPKIPSGGWFSIMVGAALLAVMMTWHGGRRKMRRQSADGLIGISDFIESVRDTDVVRIPGAAVYLYGIQGYAPPALVSHARLQHVLHEDVIILTVEIAGIPKVQPAFRLEIHELSDGFREARLRFGFMDETDVPAALTALLGSGADEALYMLSPRVAVVDGSSNRLATWRDHVFVVLHRNAGSASDSFRLPVERTLSISGSLAL